MGSKQAGASPARTASLSISAFPYVESIGRKGRTYGFHVGYIKAQVEQSCQHVRY
ncbi:hypothetical protein KDH_72590 [Dictyobacter sp. S3.2.2.5]|uniref:Uncharacterized protein n=1 Tax=Dictyobacter halimunensis TaxID=3026934 RepID=A0ABQ6G4F0_9CHLR|nr:hypothetical protein KDH_72590 [Dictyobacter sp. S3.2.2.5]